MSQTGSSLAALLLLCSACDFGIVYVDPPVQYVAGGLVIEGDPHVELGFYEEQLYDAIDKGGDCPIVHGLQGGTWTHPALRTTGIGTPAVIDCDVVLDADGEEIGAAKAFQNFFVTTESILEVQAFPIPIVHTADDKGPEIEDLYEQPAMLRCRVSDEQDRTAQASVAVMLTEG